MLLALCADQLVFGQRNTGTCWCHTCALQNKMRIIKLYRNMQSIFSKGITYCCLHTRDHRCRHLRRDHHGDRSVSSSSSSVMIERRRRLSFLSCRMGPDWPGGRGGPKRSKTARGLPGTKTARFDTESQLKILMEMSPVRNQEIRLLGPARIGVDFEVRFWSPNFNVEVSRGRIIISTLRCPEVVFGWNNLVKAVGVLNRFY